MRRPRHAPVLTVLGCLLVLAGGTAGAAPAPPLLYMSPGGSDSSRCTRASPCKSFGRAYAVASPGQHVLLAAGEYGGQQEIEKVSGRTSPRDVIFRPAPGANGRVVVESLDVFGSHVEFRGLRIERDFYVKCGADDVTLRSSKAGLFFIRSATNIRFLGTEFGPSDTISQIGHTAECRFSPRGILMDRVYMHDFTNDDPSVHMECLTVQAASDFVIRRSRFHHCEDFDILFKHRSPVLESTNVTIENTWFDKPWPDGTSAIQFSEPDSGGQYNNVLIRNNSFAGTLTLKPDVGYRNLRVIANVGSRYGGPCSGGVASYNVWRSGACGGTDRSADPKFRNERGFDFHLAPGSPAINRGHPREYPRVDIDGQKRPAGKRADAGADEFRRR
jgi:hypothetical protein